jgi:hypothetical protein
MVFSSSFNSHSKLSFYDNDYYILKGMNECNLINGYKIPEGCSSTDKIHRIALIKQYNEQLERTKLGYNTFSNQRCIAYELIQKKSVIINRSDIGYGLTPFGSMDTTGTASGLPSLYTLRKARNELLEKNELGLIWYGGIGNSILIDNTVEVLLKKNGIYEKNIYIFSSRNLSSAVAFCILIFDDGRHLISTGVSLNQNPHLALQSAIDEARLMRFTYYMIKRYSRFSFFDVDPVYDYVQQLYYTMVCLKANDIKEYKDESIEDWVSSLYAVIINTRDWQDTLTIRVFSKELLNCMPIKENIFQNKSKSIVRKYDLLSLMENVPNCVVV